MTTFKLYGIWKRVLAQWLTDNCPSRRTNLTQLIVGLYVSGKVQTSAIVQRWPMAVQASSLTRRLSRFLDNAAVRPAVWFRPVARQLLARAAPKRKVGVARLLRGVPIGEALRVKNARVRPTNFESGDGQTLRLRAPFRAAPLQNKRKLAG